MAQGSGKNMIKFFRYLLSKINRCNIDLLLKSESQIRPNPLNPPQGPFAVIAAPVLLTEYDLMVLNGASFFNFSNSFLSSTCSVDVSDAVKMRSPFAAP